MCSKIKSTNIKILTIIIVRIKVLSLENLSTTTRIVLKTLVFRLLGSKLVIIPIESFSPGLLGLTKKVNLLYSR